MVNIPGIIPDPKNDVTTELLGNNLTAKKGTYFVDKKTSKYLVRNFSNAFMETTADPQNCYLGDIDDFSAKFDRRLTEYDTILLQYQKTEHYRELPNYDNLRKNKDQLIDNYLNNIKLEKLDQLEGNTKEFERFLNEIGWKILGHSTLIPIPHSFMFEDYEPYPLDEKWAQFNQNFFKYKKFLNTYLINKTQEVLNKHSEDIKSTYDFFNDLGFTIPDKEKIELNKAPFMKTGFMNDIKELVQIGVLNPQGKLTATELINTEKIIHFSCMDKNERSIYKNNGFNVEKLFTTYIKESQKNKGNVFYESLPILITEALNNNNYSNVLQDYDTFSNFCQSKGVDVNPIGYHGTKKIVNFPDIFKILNLFKNNK